MSRSKHCVLLVALALVGATACERLGGEGGAGDRDTLGIAVPELEESLEQGAQGARRGAQTARTRVGEAVERTGEAIEEAGEEMQE